jgi:hypothetical protein
VDDVNIPASSIESLSLPVLGVTQQNIAKNNDKFLGQTALLSLTVDAYTSLHCYQFYSSSLLV